MKKYEVRSTTQANKHILDYAEYIQDELLNPEAARKYVNDIRTALKSLCEMPQRNPLTEEPWRSKGIHKMMVRGYIIYYWIEENAGVVYVIGIVYEKRNQIEQLAEMDLK